MVSPQTLINLTGWLRSSTAISIIQRHGWLDARQWTCKMFVHFKTKVYTSLRYMDLLTHSDQDLATKIIHFWVAPVPSNVQVGNFTCETLFQSFLVWRFFFKSALAHLDVSKNTGVLPPKSSILIGFPIITHPFWSILGGFSPYFWKHPFVLLLWRGWPSHCTARWVDLLRSVAVDLHRWTRGQYLALWYPAIQHMFFLSLKHKICTYIGESLSWQSALDWFVVMSCLQIYAFAWVLKTHNDSQDTQSKNSGLMRIEIISPVNLPRMEDIFKIQGRFTNLKQLRFGMLNGVSLNEIAPSQPSSWHVFSMAWPHEGSYGTLMEDETIILNLESSW